MRRVRRMKGLPVIRLHQFAPAFGLPNASPFCMKVETYLRMAGLPFEAVNDGNIMKAPKGKLPYVDDDGTLVADSSFIIEHLKQRYGDPLDAALSPLQRAQATALQRLLEENLYWAVVYTRWVQPTGWALTGPAFFGGLPPPLRWLVPLLARRGMRASLRGHGMGRHNAQEVMAIGCRDITAVADWLGPQPYMLGDAPTSVDATAYALLANVLWAPVQSPLQDHAASRPTLAAYCQRMKARYYA
jgi:glutathione S-transferase